MFFQTQAATIAGRGWRSDWGDDRGRLKQPVPLTRPMKSNDKKKDKNLKKPSVTQFLQLHFLKAMPQIKFLWILTLWTCFTSMFDMSTMLTLEIVFWAFRSRGFEILRQRQRPKVIEALPWWMNADLEISEFRIQIDFPERTKRINKHCSPHLTSIHILSQVWWNILCRVMKYSSSKGKVWRSLILFSQLESYN